MIDQRLRDVREEFAQVQKETAGVMASETAAKRAYDQCVDDINKYNAGAIAAVQAGNDDDARKLLERKKALETKCISLKQSYDSAKQSAEQMRALHDKLVTDIKLLEDRAAALKGKLAAAKTQEHINSVTAKVGSKTAGDSFDSMEKRIDARLDKASAAATLASSDSTDDLLKKYSGSPVSGSVEDELAKIKASLGQQ